MTRPAAPERVLGLDPGLEVTGYGVLDASGDRPKLLEAGVLRVPRGGPLADRLARLYASAGELLDEQKPTTVAVEELFSHYERPRTAILMGHARGVLLLAAAQRGLEVAHYLPTRVKKTMTGNGHASKAQIQRAVALEFGLVDPIAVPDVADALAVALCHFHALRARARTG
jgi:crossover junction endodeoxyribonuclease RuvC